MNRDGKDALSPRERDLEAAYFSIKRLNNGENPTLAEIANSLGISVSSVRVMLSRMESKGYVKPSKGRYRSVEILIDHGRDRMVKWIQMVGHSELARLLHTTRFVVHSWTNSRATTPKPPSLAYASRMVELSADRPLPDGPLTFNDIYDGTTGLRGRQRVGQPERVASTTR